MTLDKSLDKSFQQSVVLKQSPIWSRAIAMSLVTVTGVVIAWASFTQIEEAIPAQGKLEPEGKVTEIQAPLVGVVQELLVQEGQRVNQGDRLLRLDRAATQAQERSLRDVRNQLSNENQYYESQINGTPITMSGVNISAGTLTLTQNRANLVTENQLFQAQLNGEGGGSFTPDQQLRLRSSQLENSSRIASAGLEVEQLRSQFQQVTSQLRNAEASLATEQQILSQLTALFQEGGYAQIQYLRQQQEVQNRQAEVNRLQQEQQRLDITINQSKARLDNTVALTQQEILTRIAANDRAISEIDSQLSKIVLDNQKRISEIDSQLEQAKVTLGYQDITAPVSGTVFGLQPTGAGFVTSTTTPLLKIVPDDALVAQVFITNRDIGFVREGMDVDVRIDSFPFSEFGDIKGELVSIGSDALPPDPNRPFYSFPAKVRLERQDLSINGRQINLQSGMAVSINIKIRQRPVISIFTDLFTNKTDNLKQIR